MVTYVYWITLGILCVFLLWVLIRANQTKMGIIVAIIVFITGVSSYFFHFQQVFVKHYGGVMTLKVPQGQHHLGSTWKDDHLWIENYDPIKNICYFNEYSRGNLLQGQVVIEDCNPLIDKN
ncbi:hypothetical protein [Endozoicomonas ascidiicola]|uniref:hypothetical protein n=1 Tax=Endozoicomonas ascidiicola TaxID=1698521 RepID=UPI00082BFB63|nr:hypothetical protein [Endozoicomonas ascidiicola]USN27004.1 hypothetical protein [synthetic construct]